MGLVRRVKVRVPNFLAAVEIAARSDLVMTLPESDSYSFSREKALARLAMLFGGREAEIKKFGPIKVTSGASGDIQMATNLARSMVMEWGMSERLGRVRYRSNDQEVFLGHSVTPSQHMSDETAKLIDEEVRLLIEAGEAKAREILTTYEKEWEAVAQALLEFETLTGDELRDLMEGKQPIRPDDSGPAAPKASGVPAAGKSGRKRPDAPPEPGLEPQPNS
jgi:cell division protease FtsH